MRSAFFILLFFVACNNGSNNLNLNATTVGGREKFEPIAVLELFTSQGCSSCPAADALLAKTISEASSNNNIFALSFHVDYWNRLGWKDPFSENKYSQRQRDYITVMKLDGAYTPQMVVNGSVQFVGSDGVRLKQAVTAALDTKTKIVFTALTAAYVQDGAITIHYEITGDFNGALINVALVSLAETTHIKRGENSGLTLLNKNVVRQLVTKTAAASGQIELAGTNLPQKQNISIIAFVQQKDNLKIIGAAMVAQLK